MATTLDAELVDEVDKEEAAEDKGLLVRMADEEAVWWLVEEEEASLPERRLFAS